LLLYHLADQGYAFATVTVDLDSSRGDTATVVLVAETGQRHRFASPIFMGARRTRPTQLERDVRFAEGALFSRSLVDETGRRLAVRDYIDTVTVLAPQIYPRTVDSTGDSLTGVVVPIEVRERSGLALDGAFGFGVGEGEDAELSGLVDFSLLNVLGIGERLVVHYRGDDEVQQLRVEVGKTHLGRVPLLIEGSFTLEIARDRYGQLAGGLRGFYELPSLWRIGLGVRGQENTTPETDSTGGTWHVYAGEFNLVRPGSVWRRQRLSRELRLSTGLGVADRGSDSHTRWSVDFSAGVHLPVGRRMALAGRLVSQNLFTDEETLTPAEVYRVGGHRSIRGYADEALPFRNASYVQFEYLVYLSDAISAYIFIDGGLGFRNGLDQSSDATGMMGYGVGTRIPVRIGSATFEWARNIDDTRSLGRIHVRIASRLAHER
jgi:outer membrane protein assembly factor BamA